MRTGRTTRHAEACEPRIYARRGDGCDRDCRHPRRNRSSDVHGACRQREGHRGCAPAREDRAQRDGVLRGAPHVSARYGGRAAWPRSQRVLAEGSHAAGQHRVGRRSVVVRARHGDRGEDSILVPLHGDDPEVCARVGRRRFRVQRRRRRLSPVSRGPIGGTRRVRDHRSAVEASGRTAGARRRGRAFLGRCRIIGQRQQLVRRHQQLVRRQQQLVSWDQQLFRRQQHRVVRRQHVV